MRNVTDHRRPLTPFLSLQPPLDVPFEAINFLCFFFLFFWLYKFIIDQARFVNAIQRSPSLATY